MARATTFKYTVTVVNPGSGNKYYMDGILQTYVTLFPGCTYEFNQDDSSNGGHPLRFSETSDGTHNSGSEYTTGVTTSGTPGSATAWTKIEVTSNTPIYLYYYCSSHSGMGGIINVSSSVSNNRKGLVMGGSVGSAPGPATDAVMSVIISTFGNCADFGDLAGGSVHRNASSVSNSLRALCQGGSGTAPAFTRSNVVDQCFFASSGTSTDYGDLTVARGGVAGVSNSTRGLCAGGNTPSTSNVIDYVSLDSQGDYTDFGDLVGYTQYTSGNLNTPTRGIFFGTNDPSSQNIIQYVTIASTGNATDFGDMTINRQFCGGVTSSTRGVMSGGNSSPSSPANVIDYITMASTGNATDFGDHAILYNDSGICGLTDTTKGLFTGICAPSAGVRSTIIDYITISTTGNTADFGDLTVATNFAGGASSNHGGLA